MKEIHLCQNYATHSPLPFEQEGVSSFEWNLGTLCRVVSFFETLRSFKLSHETFRVSSLNTKGCMKVVVIVTQFGARGSKNESKYLHGCSLASSVSTFETLACV